MAGASTVTAKYHINPQTGNPGVCRAQYSCRFGSIEDDHYETKDAARAAYERRMEAATMDVDKAVSNLRKKLVHLEGPSFDNVGHAFECIDEWPKDWTKEERENLQKIEDLSELLEGEMTDEKWEKAQKIKYSMHPYMNYWRSLNTITGKADDEWKNRQRQLNLLANDLLIRKEAFDYPETEAPPRDRNDRIIGLDDARIAAVKAYNEPQYEFAKGEFFIQEDAEDYIESAVDRVVAGEEWKLKRSGETPHVSLIPERDRLMSLISDKESDKFNNQLYLVTAFPDKELKEAFDRAGIENVAVSNYENGREWGLAYTVMGPDGVNRTFSVYEHRNSDSIIINTKSDWKHDELPMAGNSKNTFIAEFAPEDHKQAADALTFFIKETQKGELPSDQELANSVSRRDWRAILSDSVPGYKEWADKVDPKNEDEDDDPLKRMGF